MNNFRINLEHLPSRCDICHQADLFEPLTGQCARCSEVLAGMTVLHADAFRPVPPPSFSLFGNASPFTQFHVRAGVAAVVVGGLLMSPIAVSMTRNAGCGRQAVKPPRFSGGKPFLSRAIVKGWRTVGNLGVLDGELPVQDVTGRMVSLELDEFLAGSISLRMTDGNVRTFYLSRIPELNEYERGDIRAMLETPGALVNVYFQELPGGMTVLNRLRVQGDDPIY